MKEPMYLMMNVGMQDWTQISTGLLENVIIEITLKRHMKKKRSF